MRYRPQVAAGFAVLAVAGCGGGSGDKGEKTTTTTPSSRQPAQTTSDTALVRCLKGQSFITVQPGAGGSVIVRTDKGEQAVIRTYDNLHDALQAGHRARLDLDQIISRQTIEYTKPGTGQIKIAVETCS